MSDEARTTISYIVAVAATLYLVAHLSLAAGSQAVQPAATPLPAQDSGCATPAILILAAGMAPTPLMARGIPSTRTESARIITSLLYTHSAAALAAAAVGVEAWHTIPVLLADLAYTIIPLGHSDA